MNVKLLRKIQKHIMEEPRRFFMGSWIIDKSCAEWKCLAEKRRPPCGSAACIGGTAKILSGYNLYVGPDPTELLGLTPDQSLRLFYFPHWPRKFQKYNQNQEGGTVRAVKMACARIDHFIKTKGRE